MLELMSEDTMARFLSLSASKKLTFALLLYERMLPELNSFVTAERRDVSSFERAHDEFWRSLKAKSSPASWEQIKQDILKRTPDTATFSSLSASFALNAALVAASIAEFLADGQDTHLLEAIGYARDSLDAYATSQMKATVYNEAVEEYVRAHPLVQEERQAEEQDIAFLETLPDAPWSVDLVHALERRAETQRSMLRGN